MSRNTNESLRHGELAADTGVRVIGASDGFDSAGQQSKIMLPMMSSFHEVFIDQLKSNQPSSPALQGTVRIALCINDTSCENALGCSGSGGRYTGRSRQRERRASRACAPFPNANKGEDYIFGASVAAASVAAASVAAAVSTGAASVVAASVGAGAASSPLQAERAKMPATAAVARTILRMNDNP
jgi:hypothetical protein